MLNKNIITGISHYGVRVYDLERSRAFYERLGFEYIIGPIGPEPVAIMIHPQSQVEINLVLNANIQPDSNILMDIKDKHAGYTHIALEINDIEAAQADLEADGIKITEGPISLGETSAIFIRDPDWNVIEFNQPSRYNKASK